MESNVNEVQNEINIQIQNLEQILGSDFFEFNSIQTSDSHQLKEDSHQTRVEVSSRKHHNQLHYKILLQVEFWAGENGYNLIICIRKHSLMIIFVMFHFLMNRIVANVLKITGVSSYVLPLHIT